MTTNIDALIFATPRTDGALIPGDITSGQPSSEVALRAPISQPSTLGNPNAPARVVGDQVSGMPNVTDNPAPPALGIIERVPDSSRQLPHRAGGEP